jgi:GntR family transcriptional regulator
MLVRPELEQPLQGMYSLAATVRSKGLDEHSEVLACKLSVAEEAAVQLGIAKDEQVVYIERLRYAGDEPLALDRSWLPADLAQGLLDADLSSGSLYDSLAQHCNLRVTSGWERIRPLNPSSHDREMLRLPLAEAVFAIERLAWAGDRPLEWRISLIRGDRYCFRSTWTGPVGNLVSMANQLV